MNESVIRLEINNKGSLADFIVTVNEASENPERMNRVSMATFMGWVAVNRKTGIIRCILEQDETVRISVNNGQIGSVENSNFVLMNKVVENLVEQRKITPSQAEKAKAEASASGHLVIQVLFEMGVASPQTLVNAIRNSKESCLTRLFAVHKLLVEWQNEKTMPRTDPVTVDAVAFMVGHMREATRNSYVNDIEPFFSDVQGRYPIVSDKLGDVLTGQILTEKERKNLDTIADGTSTLVEAFAISLLSKTQTARLLLICRFMGFVDFHEVGRPKGGVETLEKDLRLRLDKIKSEDLFVRLGLHWTSHPSRIDGAYARAYDRWGPSAVVRRHSSVTALTSAEILLLMDEAYGVIRDKAKRDRYRFDTFGRETLLFGTEFLFKQANLALFREEREKAREIIEAAIDIIPKKEFVDFLEELR